MRKVTKNKSVFPVKDALLKSLFLGIRNLEKRWAVKVRMGYNLLTAVDSVP
jgi:hypothetical protein